MKKSLPYIIGALALVALVLLLIGSPRNSEPKFDERISLRQKDKIPYGTYAAQHLLSSLFPHATVSADKAEPGYWADLDTEDSNQLVILVAKTFNAETYELKRLAEFAQKGNYVFVIARDVSYTASEFFGINDASDFFFTGGGQDSLAVMLEPASFSGRNRFEYPGKRYDSYLFSYDTARTVKLGNNNHGYPNFIAMQSGSGRLMLHLAPMAFTNYFILHKKNIEYFEKAMSLVPPTVSHVVWNEYYLGKRNSHPEPEPEPGILSVLWEVPAFKWALLAAIFTLGLYVLLEMRRRQRFIPVWSRPANDSLQFIRTMGRLYYEKGDHRNLAQKMAGHFTEHVRTRYKLSGEPDDEFARELARRSGYPSQELQRIVTTIYLLRQDAIMEKQDLISFYQQLESFYQNT